MCKVVEIATPRQQARINGRPQQPQQQVATRTFFNFSIAAFSFFSHFLADLCIYLLVMRRSINCSSNDTLFPMMLVGLVAVVDGVEDVVVDDGRYDGTTGTP